MTSLRRRFGNGAALALVRRDLLIQRSYRTFLVAEVFAGVLNLLVYYFISRTFNGIPTADLGGAPSYFDFAVVGITLAIVVTAATHGVVGRVREEQLTGTLEVLVAQPISTRQMAIGLGGMPFLLATFTAAWYLVAASLLLGLDLSKADWTGVVVILLAAGGALSSLGLLAAAAVLVIKRGGSSIIYFLLFGMGLVSGGVFPVSVLPDWLRGLSVLVPLRYALDGIRAALFQGGHWGHEALLLLLFGALLLPPALWLFDRALLATKRAGSLAQY